jgi:outer membrane protein assembly factor BamB
VTTAVGRSTIRALIGTAAMALAMTGCSEREELLSGPREAIRTELGLAEASPAPAISVPIALPPMRTFASWPMRAGAPDNVPGHAALAAAPAPVWSVRMGTGASRRAGIAGDPVSDGARIFAMDAANRVTAVTPAGQVLWSRDLVPPNDRANEASGGGLAVVDGTLYATTGFGEVHALDATSGGTRWVQRLDAPLTSPKAAGGLVYVVSRDGRAWAISAANGRLRWEIPSVAAPVVSASAPGPALSERLVVLPFGSGELVAALRVSGVPVWNAVVFGGRVGVALSTVDDVTGDPVIADGRVYAATLSGRTLALDLETGERIWTARDGAVSAPVAVGGSVFTVSDRNQLLRLDAATGRVVWRRDLPFFRETRVNRREGIFAQHGPVLAGGRLWVGSSDGYLRGFSPASGALQAALPVPSGAATRPIAVGGALYVMARDGTLHAFR